MSATARLLLSTGCAILFQPTSIEINQAKAPLNWAPVSLTTPSGDTIRADTAWLTVPQRHGRPDGASVQLPLMRLKATAARPGSPILYLAGGPGASGLGAFRDADRGPHSGLSGV